MKLSPLPPAGSRNRPAISPVRALLLAACAVLAFVVAVPILGIAERSISDPSGGYTLQTYVEFLQNERLLTATRNTLLVAVVTAGISVAIGVPLAFGVARTDMRGKRMVNVAIIIAFASPPFLSTLAYVVLAGPNSGLLNMFLRSLIPGLGDRGPLDIFSLLGFAFLAIPPATALVYLTIFPTLGNMDPSMEEASRISGADPRRTLWRVSLPLLRPGILGGALLAFSTALAMYAVPYMLGLNVLTISIRSALVVTGDFEQASMLAVVTSIFALVVLYLYRKSVKYALRFQTISGRGFRPAVLKLGRFSHLLTALGVTFAVVGAFLPYAIIFWTSFVVVPADGLGVDNFTLANYTSLYSEASPRSGLTNSLILGFGSAVVVAGLGFLLAFMVVSTRMRGRALVDYLAVLPLGIPGTAFAVGVIVVYLAWPLDRLELYGTVGILFVAYVGRYIPFGVRTMQASLMQVGGELVEASRVTGGTEGQTVRSITLPLVRSGLTYAFILGFLQSFNEVSASALLVGAGNEVASTALLALFVGPQGLPRASAMAVVMFVLTMSLVLLAQRFGDRSIVPRTDGGNDKSGAEARGAV